MAHGLDRSKLTAAALFYRPCQPKERAASYFEDFAGELLDPVEWIENASDENICRYAAMPFEADDRAATPSNTLSCNPETVERALRAWRNANHHVHHDNDEFFLLGCRLKQAGCSIDKIARLLRHEAAVANTPRDREAQIAGVLSSLARYVATWNVSGD
jgi:hypothetical protein